MGVLFLARRRYFFALRLAWLMDKVHAMHVRNKNQTLPPKEKKEAKPEKNGSTAFACSK